MLLVGSEASLSDHFASVSGSSRLPWLVEMLEKRDRPLPSESEAVLELTYGEAGPIAVGEITAEAVQLALRQKESLRKASDAFALVELAKHAVEDALLGPQGGADLLGRGRCQSSLVQLLQNALGELRLFTGQLVTTSG